MKKKIICLALIAAVIGGFAVSAGAKQDFVLNGLESEYYIRINAVDKNGVLNLFPPKYFLELATGLEPATNGLQNRCTTIVLH